MTKFFLLLCEFTQVSIGRNSYTVDFKLKSIRRLNGEFQGNLSQASRVLGTSRKQLRDWLKLESKLANVGDKTNSRTLGSGARAKFPLLEEKHIV